MKRSKLLFEGVRFNVESLPVTTSSGKEMAYQVVIHPGAVVILPLLNQDEIILIKNERYAVGKKLWELPAGTLKKGEEPKLAASRELEEETGYRAKKMEPLLSFYTTPGFCNEMLHIYLATELTKAEQNLDETEKIEVHVIKLEKAIDMIRQKEIIDGKTIATLLYYKNSLI